MLKRSFDILLSVIGLLILFPLLIVITIAILLDSKGGAFYHQRRVGRQGNEFRLHKFRTMKPYSDSLGLLTIGGKDPRITKIGYSLRKYKLDELPQLFNVLKGEMSFVGPRPEVKKYVNLYTEEQRKVLTIRPGITDYASLEYFNENDVLAESSNPEQTYIEEIMPAKLTLNTKYLKDTSLKTDLKIIYATILRIVGKR